MWALRKVGHDKPTPFSDHTGPGGVRSISINIGCNLYSPRDLDATFHHHQRLRSNTCPGSDTISLTSQAYTRQKYHTARTQMVSKSLLLEDSDLRSQNPVSSMTTPIGSVYVLTVNVVSLRGGCEKVAMPACVSMSNGDPTCVRYRGEFPRNQQYSRD